MKTCEHDKWIKENQDAYCVFIQDTGELIDICEPCFEDDPEVVENTINNKTNYLRETENKNWNAK
jgi:hypothetical protein